MHNHETDDNDPTDRQKTSRLFLLSKMHQLRPPWPDLTPKSSSAAVGVQPIFKPVRIEEIAAGLRVLRTKAGVLGR
jgi:hypothetical protein